MIEPQESRVQKIEDLIDIRDALDLFENDFADHQAYPEGKQNMKSKTSKMNGATKEMTDGDLTHNDLWEAFRDLGFTKSREKCQEIMEKNKQTLAVYDDKNNIRESSLIDFPRFIQDLLNEFRDPVNNDELRKAFNVLDADKDGLISVENVRRMLVEFNKHLKNDELLQIFESVAPEDSTRLVSFEQFHSMINEAEDNDVNTDFTDDTAED